MENIPDGYLGEPGAVPPPLAEAKHEHAIVQAAQVDGLQLVKPDNVKSRFWTHFMKYDQGYHPDKKTTARCSLCGKDISIRQGTGGLKNHMKFKHPAENALLFDDDEEAAAAAAAGTPSRGGAAEPPRKKQRAAKDGAAEAAHDQDVQRALDVTTRQEIEQRAKEKHWLEMWSGVRREMRDVRAEIRAESDNPIAVRELEEDLRVLRMKKAEYSELLGFPREGEEEHAEEEAVEEEAVEGGEEEHDGAIGHAAQVDV